MNRHKFTGAGPPDEYVDLALESPSSYNQGAPGVSTLVRVRYFADGDDTSVRHGWIDFARHVDVARALRVLRENGNGMKIDWTHDETGIRVDADFDADSTDDEIREAVRAGEVVDDSEWAMSAAWYEARAVEYWIDARNTARDQRELVSEAAHLLEGAAMTTDGRHRAAPAEWDSGKLREARELVGKIVDLESWSEAAPTYGPALTALDPAARMPAKAPSAAELARETLRDQAQSRSR